MNTWKKWVLIIAIIASNLTTESAHAQIANDYLQSVVNAIYKAEGGEKAKPYYYGIRSIDCKGNKLLCRKYCENTVRNHWERHKNHAHKMDFLECLGLRYCPPTAHHLNKNWITSVRYFLKKGNT